MEALPKQNGNTLSQEGGGMTGKNPGKEVIDLFGDPETIVVASVEPLENPNGNGIRHFRIMNRKGDAYDVDDTWIPPGERPRFNEQLAGEVITIDPKRRLARLDGNDVHPPGQLELFEPRPDQFSLFGIG